MTTARHTSLSIRSFVLFSLFVYPIGLLLFIWRERLIQALHSEVLFVILLFLGFLVLNWIWGQKRLATPLLIGSYIAGNVLFFFWAQGSVEDRSLYGDTIPLLMALILYPISFLVFTFAQFFTWVPFLLKYLYANRHNLNKNLSWE